MKGLETVNLEGFKKGRFGTIVLGMPDYGKSHLVKKILTYIPRFIVTDIEHEYSVVPKVRTYSRLPDLCGYINRQVKINRYHFPLRVAFNGFQKGQFSRWSEIIEGLAEVCYMLENVCFVGEEINYAQDSNSLSEIFNAIAHSGKHYGNSFFAVSRRPQDIHPTLRGAASTWFIFRVEEFNALNMLKNYLPKETIETIRTLPVGECVVYGPETEFDKMRLPAVLRPKNGILHVPK